MNGESETRIGSILGTVDDLIDAETGQLPAEAIESLRMQLRQETIRLQRLTAAGQCDGGTGQAAALLSEHIVVLPPYCEYDAIAAYDDDELRSISANLMKHGIDTSPRPAEEQRALLLEEAEAASAASVGRLANLTELRAGLAHLLYGNR